MNKTKTIVGIGLFTAIVVVLQFLAAEFGLESFPFPLFWCLSLWVQQSMDGKPVLGSDLPSV